MIRRGYRPSKIAFLAWHAWHDAEAGEWPPGYPAERRAAYDLPDIRHWLEVFCKRFFANQFKRSALPNGPKVSSRRHHEPARRLADAVRRERRRLACRARANVPTERRAPRLPVEEGALAPLKPREFSPN